MSIDIAAAARGSLATAAESGMGRNAFPVLEGRSAPRTGSADTTAISPETQALLRTRYALGAFEALFEARTGQASRYKTLDEVARDFREDYARLSGLLGPLFKEAGLGERQAIEMRLDGKGHVLATAGGEDAALVNSLFAADPSLVSQFAVMAARGALAQAGETVPGFAGAYAQDPPAAIREYIGDLERLLFAFTLTAGPDGMGYAFAGG